MSVPTKIISGLRDVEIEVPVIGEDGQPVLDQETGQPVTETRIKQVRFADVVPLEGDELADYLAREAAHVPGPGRRDFEDALEEHLDSVARARGYASGERLATYATSGVYGAEAQAFIAWRDAVWVYALAELAKVEAGQRSKPDEVDEFLAELPAIEWPD